MADIEDLRVIQEYLVNGKLLLGAEELCNFIKLHSSFRLEYTQVEKVEIAREELKKIQQRWQSPTTISEEDHLEWITRGLFIHQISVVLEQKMLAGEGQPVPTLIPEQQWDDAEVLRVTVQGNPYFLQGFNATLFDELVRAPWFLEQLPQSEEVRKLFIEDLAIALATIDRRHSTPRALKVLKLLWSKERKRGIGKYIELLEPEYWPNSVWPNSVRPNESSDHLNHILKVYLTGIYLYQRCDALRNQLLQNAGCTNEEFLRQWLYVSTLHDLGHIFELSTMSKQSETLAFIQDYIQHFFTYYDQDTADDLEQAIIAPRTIDKPSAERIFSLLRIKLPLLQQLDNLLFIEVRRNGHARKLAHILDDLCKKTGIGVHGMSNYYQTCRASSPPKADGREPFYDHGITSALLLLYVGYMLHTLFHALHRDLAAQKNGRRKPLEQTGRIEVLQKMDLWGQENGRALETFEQVAAAIALHNISKQLWTTGELSEQIDLANFWIRLDREPLAFLLILVDRLQNWDQAGSNLPQPSEESLLSSDIDIEPGPDKIFVGYPHKADEYEMTIRRLKSILLPGQVDQWIAPRKQRAFLPSPLRDRKMATYNLGVINRLKSAESDPFIDSQILPVNLRMEPGEAENRTYSIFQVAEQFAQKPVVLLGVPGIGKTRLAKHLAIHYAQTGQLVPVFIDMARYAQEDDFLESLRKSIDETGLNALLEAGKLAVIFDGLNEVESNQRDDAADRIADFVGTYPQNQFFITCRTAEYPNLPADVRYFEVLPIKPHEVRDYLIETVGVERGTSLYTELSPTLRDLCCIPLMLAMLVYICTGTRNQSQSSLPASKIALYKKFLDRLFSRKENPHYILPSSEREKFLIHLAQKMGNKQVAVKTKQAAEWIEEYYQQWSPNMGIELTTVQREILGVPPLVYSKPEPQSDISFMHQTFQEYYTACGLLDDLQHQKITHAEIVALTLSDLEIWSETLILLVGMMQDATPLIKTIKNLAIEHKGRRILLLVAGCIGEAGYVDPSEVDSVTLRIIFEFKYGKVPFDYELIESLKSIRPEKRSQDFPLRLIDDMQHWVTKYAKEQGVNLGNSIAISTLLDYLESDDEMLLLNALSTLRSHPQRYRAVDKLISKLQHSTHIVREQTIITLGYLEEAASAATDLLIAIMKDRTENDLARVHAIAALSKIGDVKAVEAMLEYVCDHTNNYRDTAAWAPLLIARQHLKESALLQHLKKVLLEDLLREPDTLEGRYTKGNALYTLGELGAIEYASPIAVWLKSQTEAYVIEDGIHTLGLIGGKNEIELIRTHLKNEDCAVRMIAAQALATLQKRVDQDMNIRPDLERLQHDKTAVVREFVANILGEL